MKKILFILLMVMIAAFSFGDGFSGDTRSEVGYDLDDAAVTCEIDAGAVYNVGWFTMGIDVFTDTFKDLNIGVPLTAVFGGFTVKAEPGLDNLFAEKLYVFDGDITYAIGMLSVTGGMGYGTDKILDITGKAVFTPADWVHVDLEYLDGTDLMGGVIGDLELSCTLLY